MEKITTLNIKFNFNGMEDSIHPVVLLDCNDMMLVDCGYPGFLPLIEEAFYKEGLNCGNLKKVFITHHDYDHMGSLLALKKKYPHIKVISGSTEAPYITGKKKALRLEQAEKLQESLPQEQKAFGLSFCEMLKGVELCPVDIQVNDQDMLDLCGGCKIIETPGHTSGHISLYLEKHRTIITGDAAVIENNRLATANPQYAFDLKSAESSLAKLLEYDAGTYICYHGGSCKAKY